MKLRLKNFRCYDEKTFELGGTGDGGIVLINGASGIGKSTILHAIHFVIYGVGTKVIKHGKTSCSVEMEYDDLKIKRTKCPNRLVVNDKYEGDVAQNILVEKFGEFFQMCSYISQNTMNSFVMMSPTEKLVFLENFCFANTNVSQLKQKTKELIDEKYNNLQKVRMELEVSEKISEELEPIGERVLFPIKCKKSQVPIVINNEKIRFGKCQKSVVDIRHKISQTNLELSDTKVLKERLINIKQNNTELRVNLEKIQLKIKNIDKELYDGFRKKIGEDINKFGIFKELLFRRQEYSNKNEILKDMKKNEEEEMKNKLHEFKDELWKEYGEDELDNIITEYEEYFDDIREYEKNLKKMKYLEKSKVQHDNLSKRILELENEIEKINISQNSFKCPCCSVILYLKDSELKTVPTEKLLTDDSTINSQNRIDELEIEMNKWKSLKSTNVYDPQLHKNLVDTNNSIKGKYDEIVDSQDIKNTISELQQYKNKQISLSTRIENLEQKIQKGIYSSSYCNFRDGVTEIFKKIKQLEDRVDSSLQEELTGDTNEKLTYIEEKISNLKLQLCKYDEKVTVRKELLKDSEEIREKISRNDKTYSSFENRHRDSFGRIFTEDELEDVIKILEKELVDTKLKMLNHEKNLETIKQWEKYDTGVTTHKNWKTKIQNLKNDEVICRRYYDASKVLKEKIQESESIALYNMINSLNSYVKTYLDLFFVEEPISITLKPFKKTKNKVKSQLNFEIFYKNMDCNLGMLSGGETSRVILAYTLALSEMTQSPLLLLDECTSSLDQELTGDVFEVIRENFKNKTVIFIAHQIVTGQFDKIINL